jgi:hypothetical protein
MGILSPQTKHTANIPSFLLFQNKNNATFQTGIQICIQQWLQAIINVFTKD